MRANINTKMVITGSPEHPQGSKFDQNLPTMSPEAPAHPKGPNINCFCQFLKVLGGHKVAKILYTSVTRAQAHTVPKKVDFFADQPPKKMICSMTSPKKVDFFDEQLQKS